MLVLMILDVGSKAPCRRRLGRRRVVRRHDGSRREVGGAVSTARRRRIVRSRACSRYRQRERVVLESKVEQLGVVLGLSW
jgi:hypothetical protein